MHYKDFFMPDTWNYHLTSDLQLLVHRSNLNPFSVMELNTEAEK